MRSCTRHRPVSQPSQPSTGWSAQCCDQRSNNARTGKTTKMAAFARWVEREDPAAFRRLMDESLEELRSVTAA
jgi:hypothetical protein